MNTPEAEALVERAPAVAEGSGPTAWKLSLSVLSLSLAALLLVYFDTFRSMAEIWSRSDTYVHGYFVLPISLYLIWTLRAEVRKLSPRADALALVPIAIAGVGWMAARLGGVLVAEQYFAVASIPLMVWAVAGPSVVVADGRQGTFWTGANGAMGASGVVLDVFADGEALQR